MSFDKEGWNLLEKTKGHVRKKLKPKDDRCWAEQQADQKKLTEWGFSEPV